MIPEDDQTPAEAGLEERIAARLGGTTTGTAADLRPMPMAAAAEALEVTALPAETTATARDIRHRLGL